MASNAALSWLDGRGWLVFAGSVQGDDAIRARLLGTAAADGAVVVVVTQGSNLWAEQVLADLEDLGAQAGYLVDAITEDDEAIRSRLSEAGVIVIGGEESVSNLRSALTGAAIEGMQAAFKNGAVILAEGPGAMLFGAWNLLDDGKIVDGFEWLLGALIVPGAASVSNMPLTQEVMAMQPAAIAVGIGIGAALALGPDGQVDIWGDQQVSIALGPDFSA
jgi:hypothetical protein